MGPPGADSLHDRSASGRSAFECAEAREQDPQECLGLLCQIAGIGRKKAHIAAEDLCVNGFEHALHDAGRDHLPVVSRGDADELPPKSSNARCTYGTFIVAMP